MRARTFVAAGWLNLLLQVALLLALWSADRLAHGEVAGPFRPVALLLIVGASSATWALFFYLQDRRRAEPARYVAAAFLAGMGAAAVFAVPIERDLFRSSEWLFRSTATLWLGTTLVRGALMALLVHLVIRHWFAPSREFDEPVDGMVYGAMIGSGYATVTSLTYLVARADLTLFAIGYTAAVQILIYASIGALVGHLTGRPKFGRGGAASPALAVVAGAVLTGLYHVASDAALLTGSGHALWLSFAVTLGLSLLAMGAVTVTMGRLGDAPGRPAAGGGRLVRSAPAWIAALLLLAAGAAVAYRETRDVTVASEIPPLALRYPPAAIRPGAPAPPVLALVPGTAIVFSGAARGADRVGITVAARPGRIAVDAVDPLAYLSTPRPLGLTVEPFTVAGRPALRARYAYVDDGDRLAGDLPDMLWAFTDIVPGPTHVVVFALEGRPEGFRGHEALYRGILDSVRWSPR